MQASGACREEGAQRRRKRIKEKKSRERKRERRGKKRGGEKKKRKGGARADLRNDENGGGWLQEGRGWEQKNTRGNPRVWRLGGLGLVWAALSPLEIFIFFCKII